MPARCFIMPTRLDFAYEESTDPSRFRPPPRSRTNDGSVTPNPSTRVLSDTLFAHKNPTSSGRKPPPPALSEPYVTSLVIRSPVRLVGEVRRCQWA